MIKERLMDKVRREIRIRHYSLRTEQSYMSWIRRFIYYHDKKHPLDVDEDGISQFLSHLATDRKVTAPT